MSTFCRLRVSMHSVHCAGILASSRLRTLGYCLPFHPTRSAPRIWVFEAQYPAHQCLCLRFACCLTATGAKLEVRMVRYSFPARLFHSLLHAGLSRRSGCPRISTHSTHSTHSPANCHPFMDSLTSLANVFMLI
jgi:hypothetical protein